MGKFMIQACELNGKIAYSVFVNTEKEMVQEIIDGLNSGFIMQVGKKQPNNSKE